MPHTSANHNAASDAPDSPRTEKHARLRIDTDYLNGHVHGADSSHSDTKEHPISGRSSFWHTPGSRLNLTRVFSTSSSPDGKKPTRWVPTVNLDWIPANWTWSKLKPVIRSAIAAWVSIVLLVISKVEQAMGQAAFLIVITAFLSPPSDPFIATLEREFLIVLFVTMAWAWSCLGVRLATLAREYASSSVSLTTVFTGAYIEAAPSVITAIFLFLGSSFFLYIRARQGPGPFTFPTVLGCITLDISLTTANFVPYPYYSIGQAVVVPIALHAGIALLSSILIFPSTISAQFTDRLIGVLNPLATALAEHRKLLQMSTMSPQFSPSAINAAVAKSESGLVPLAATARLMRRDFVWSRFSPGDLVALQNWARRLSVRANGLGLYFTLIDPLRERFPITPVASRPGTPGWTPAPSRGPSRPASRAPSPEREESEASHPGTPALQSPPGDETEFRGRTSSPGPRKKRARDGGHRHSHQSSGHSAFNLHHHLQHKLHMSMLSPTREQAVGVFESLRYLDIESTQFSHPLSSHYTERATELLRESCDELLERCESGLRGLCVWLSQTRQNRLKFWRSRTTKDRVLKEKREEMERLRSQLDEAISSFRTEKRHLILEPYRGAFDSKQFLTQQSHEMPPHRHLFHCYVYEYHLVRVAQDILEMLNEVVACENERKRLRFWTPGLPFLKFFTSNVWEPTDNLERDDDENPDVIQGILPEWEEDLGEPVRRDPDALPPHNTIQAVINRFYMTATGLGRGNALYAIKAGIFTAILSIPLLLKSTAHFAYTNRFTWGVFMGQLTLVRFRGDTTFGLVTRIISTFLGGLVGTAMWYISTGSGLGNPYGMCAVTGVAFPFFFYARLYWPGPPMTNIIFFTTIIIVIGFSWQDTHYPMPSSPGWGVDVAWRRFVLVTAGVTAAFIISFLPPTTTLRRYQRRTLSTTATEIGTIYCSIISFANTPQEIRVDRERQEIIRSLIAIRAKLKRSLVLRANIVYEFSFRGRWPAKRYKTILDLQLQIAYLLSHLFSVVEQLEPAWSQAFLRRTRFLDADFLGDVLAVISMVSTSLRTGDPLPQITPCPLLDRFMAHHHGLNVPTEEEVHEEYGVPRTLTLETLENEQYLYFCVGVSTSYGIVTRLDRLMVAVKEVVGEQYHVHGVGLSRRHGVEMGSRVNSLRPAFDA